MLLAWMGMMRAVNFGEPVERAPREKPAKTYRIIR
jgi:hypothetical protein